MHLLWQDSTISCTPSSRSEAQEVAAWLLQSVPAVTAPQGQLWHVAVALQPDSPSSHALMAREGHHTPLDTYEQLSFASREDTPLEQCQDPTLGL